MKPMLISGVLLLVFASSCMSQWIPIPIGTPLALRLAQFAARELGVVLVRELHASKLGITARYRLAFDGRVLTSIHRCNAEVYYTPLLIRLNSGRCLPIA